MKLLPSLLFAAAACASSPPTPAPLTQTQVRGLVDGAVAGAKPDRTADEIATLRKGGRASLDALLARYDAMPSGPDRIALAATIDAVAGQRYATASRLFWHTDLAAAQAEAAAEDKPILSLRMLGRLDEDLSCANSRLFRTILYPDPAIAKTLRGHFVLHWASERPAPQVTIDFGDGRAIKRTITGNSIHYILDASGTPIDALPGMYAPKMFEEELGRTLGMYQAAAKLPPRERVRRIQQYHVDRIGEIDNAWRRLGGKIVFDVTTRTVLRSNAAQRSIEAAERTTVSKMAMEAPDMITVLDIGADPRTVARDLEVWSVIGQALYEGRWGEAPPAREQYRGVPRADATTRRPARPQPAKLPSTLSREARTLVTSLIRGEAAALPPADVDAVLDRLEQTMIGDTAMNQMQLRRLLHDFLSVNGELPTLEKLNRRVYAEVFATPADDRWLGLLPRDVYTGIPGDGAVIPQGK